MIPVYICEDEAAQLKYMNETINQIIKKNNYDMAITACCSSPDSFINYIDNNIVKELGLYFLDIDLSSSLNGFDLANHIRTVDPRGFIVIVTTHSELLPQTFEYMIEPIGYIIKGSNESMDIQLEKCMDKVVKRYSALNKNNSHVNIISFSIYSKEVFLDADDIFYITISSNIHHLEICTSNEILQTRGTINETLRKLPDNFVQISRDTIINASYIKEFDAEFKTVTLTNDTSFNITKRKFSQIRKRYSSK